MSERLIRGYGAQYPSPMATQPSTYPELRCRGASLVPRRFASIWWEGKKMLKASHQIIKYTVLVATLMLAYLLGIMHTFIWLVWK